MLIPREKEKGREDKGRVWEANMRTKWAEGKAETPGL
jgi:hypothetical protein